MKTFEKFFRSRNGVFTLLGIAAILLVIVAYSSDVLGGLTGTAGVSYPMPPNGFTCLPTCVENDAKMFSMIGSDQGNISTPSLKVWIMVPGDQSSFTLGIFDGDSSKDSKNKLTLSRGQWNYNFGNWDNALSGDTTYALYADPLVDGSVQTPLASWKGNDVMPNNAWWETVIDSNEQAKAPNGHYYYRLEATRTPDGKGTNSFKVRASGYLMTGFHQEWPVPLSGVLASGYDIAVVYPESQGVITNLGNQSTYSGDWQVTFNLPLDSQKIEIWDGDFDRGGSNADTDDLNTAGKAVWSSSTTLDEGVRVVSNKQDDSSINAYKVSPFVSYEILNPDGQPICVNDNPSGSKEWENFIVSSDSADNPDCLLDAPLVPGMYRIHIVGLDLQNNIWLSVNYPICDPDGGCPPMPNE